MGTELDRFDDRLQRELREDFDGQTVHTPPPQLSRYALLADRPRRTLPLRAPALVSALVAVGVLAGFVLGTRMNAIERIRDIGTTPAATARATPPGALSAPAASPSGSGPAAVGPGPSTPAGRPPRPSTATPGSGAPPGPQFSDGFESDAVGANPPAGWRVDSGQWDGVVDDGGHVVRHDTVQPAAYLSTGSSQWSDYSVSAGIKTGLLELGSAGVAGRYQDPGDGYECGVTGAQLDLWRVQGGVRQSLAASTVLSLDFGSFHTVRLDMHGSQLTCSLDGTTAVHATDATFSSGRIALVADAGEAAEFDNVRVTP